MIQSLHVPGFQTSRRDCRYGEVGTLAAPNEGRGSARGKANEMPQATPSQMALKRSFWKGERRPEQVRRAVCSECGSRWPRGQLSKISRQRRELCRLSKNVSVLGDNWNSMGMAELPLPQYYREQAVRLRQMAKAASSLITRAEVRGACDLPREAR